MKYDNRQFLSNSVVAGLVDYHITNDGYECPDMIKQDFQRYEKYSKNEINLIGRQRYKEHLQWLRQQLVMHELMR